MRINTAVKLFSFLFLFFLCSFSCVYAQTPVQVDEENVTVNANITVDLYSQVTLQPYTVEIGQPSSVNISTLNPEGTPRSSRIVYIYIQGFSSGTNVSQPASTDFWGQTTGSVRSSISGSYNVCVKDTTEGYDILISDCEVLYVIPVPVPVLLPEPMYTEGSSNILMWNIAGSGVYQFYVEMSKDSSFSNIEGSSGWISNLAYEFSGLDDGQMYFYRVKARNIYGGESDWSSSVFSAQDSTGPSVEVLEVSDIEENNTFEWEKDFVVTVKYRIKDNVSISSHNFWCVSVDDSKYECPYLVTTSGDLWNMMIKLKDLELYGNTLLYNQYTFCVEIIDSVGNVTRNCEAKLEIPNKEDEGEIEYPKPPVETPEEPEKPKPPVTVVSIVNQISKAFENIVRNTIGQLEPQQVQDITITTSITNVAVSVGFMFSALTSLPYFVTQLVLALLSLLGFRKKGNIAGYVYSSLTKEPLRQAIVRIFDKEGALVWTDVTDAHGYFRSSDLPDAEYYMKVTAREHIFPSKIIFGKTDFPLDNVYHGDSFKTKQNKVPSFSIPLDQEEVSKFKKSLARFVSQTKAIWQSLHFLLFAVGLIFSIYALYVTPVWWNYLILFLYIPSFLALFSSLFSKKEKYGIVRDQKKSLVAGVIIGLREKEFDKLISKRITDSLGRYRFLVDRGIYDIEILNSDIKPLNGEKLLNLEVKQEGGSLLMQDIFVEQLEGVKERGKGEKK